MPMVDPSAIDPASLPVRFGRYELLSVLGHGAMGRVYEADLIGPAGFRKRVALKVLHSAARDEGGELTHEARLGGLMAHPNVVDTYELGEHEDSMYVAMELVRGPTLTGLINQGGGLPARAAVELLIQLGAGLAHAHGLQLGGRAVGLVHRDLKPANVLLTPEGLVKVADFGIAVLTSVDRGPTAAGTRGYMPPEQLAGEPIDARADLFALGVMGWECVAGRRLIETQRHHRRIETLAGLEAALDTPAFQDPVVRCLPGLLPVLRRCLRADPGDRPRSAAEVVASLRALDVPPEHSLAETLAARGFGTAAGQALSGIASAAPVSVQPTTARHPTVHHNLGGEPDGFFGRVDELKALGDLFSGGSRVVVLKGPGGAGKTRLSRHYGIKAAQGYPGGAWFVDLSECESEEATLHAIGSVLELGAAGGDADRIGAALAERSPLLLILDNAEQVARTVARVVRLWTRSSPDTRFLVTSRERLRVRGERVVELGELTLDAAVALFEERARERGWEPVDGDDRRVRRIVKHLDGLPLAIELAAARARLMPPSAILERIEDRFALLRGGQRGGPQRQSSLDAAIRGSWDVLDPAEQSALAQLAVFAGSFDLESAEAVVDISRFPTAPWMMDVVESLLDRSLLVADPSDAPRFRTLESIRAFSVARLAEHGEAFEVACWMRHAEHMLSLIRPARERDVPPSERDRARERLIPEIDNLAVAARRMTAVGETERACILAIGSAIAIQRTGPYRPGYKLLRDVRQTLRPERQLGMELIQWEGELAYRAGLLEALQHTVDAARALLVDDATPIERFREAIVRSFVEFQTASWDEAEVAMEQALAAAREAGLWCEQGLVLRNLGSLAARRGRFQEARELTTRSLQIHEAHGDTVSGTSARMNLASIAKELGDLAQAEQTFREVMVLAEKIGDRPHFALAQGNLAVVCANLGKLEEAVRLYHRTIRSHRALGARRHVGAARMNLCSALLTLGRHDEALEQVDLALPLLEGAGSRMQLAIALHNRGRILVAMGRMDEARPVLTRSVEVAEAAQTPVVIGASLASVATMEIAAGRLDEAREQLDRSLVLLREANNPIELLTGLLVEAELLIREGDREGARTRLAEIRQRAESTGMGPTSSIGLGITRIEGLLDG